MYQQQPKAIQINWLKWLGIALIVIGIAGEAYEFSTSLRGIIIGIAKDLLRMNLYSLVFSLVISLVPIAYAIIYLLTGETPLKIIMYPFIYLDVGIFFLSVLLIGLAMSTNDDEAL